VIFQGILWWVERQIKAGKVAVSLRKPMHHRMTDADPRPQHQEPYLIDRHRRARMEAEQTLASGTALT